MKNVPISCAPFIELACFSKNVAKIIEIIVIQTYWLPRKVLHIFVNQFASAGISPPSVAPMNFDTVTTTTA